MPQQGLKARLKRLEAVFSKTPPFLSEPVEPSDWNMVVQRAREDPRTIDEYLEELRRPTVYQDPRSPTEHEHLHEEIRTFWLGVFERLEDPDQRTGLGGGAVSGSPLPGGARGRR